MVFYVPYCCDTGPLMGLADGFCGLRSFRLHLDAVLCPLYIIDFILSTVFLTNGCLFGNLDARN